LIALVLSLLTLTVAGCGGGDEPSSGATNTSTTPAEPYLPPEVAEKRDAIVAAAKSFDYDRLETLLDPKNFSYSFGESGDPVGYWRRLEEEGHVPILGDYLPLVFSAPYARKQDTFVWPSAHAKKPADWTDEDRQWLTNLYTEQEIRQFERAGSYLGYRAGIRADGTWLFFVAGD
jgi:hypothetical protein